MCGVYVICVHVCYVCMACTCDVVCDVSVCGVYMWRGVCAHVCGTVTAGLGEEGQGGKQEMTV